MRIVESDDLLLEQRSLELCEIERVGDHSQQLERGRRSVEIASRRRVLKLFEDIRANLILRARLDARRGLELEPDRGLDLWNLGRHERRVRSAGFFRFIAARRDDAATAQRDRELDIAVHECQPPRKRLVYQVMSGSPAKSAMTAAGARNTPNGTSGTSCSVPAFGAHDATDRNHDEQKRDATERRSYEYREQRALRTERGAGDRHEGRIAESHRFTSECDFPAHPAIAIAPAPTHAPMIAA